MPSVASIQAKIDNASNKYGLGNRAIYKRVTTITTLNPLLVESQYVSTQDTVLNPQPFYSRPDKIEVGSLRAPTDVLSADGTAALPNTEYTLFCSPNCLSLNDLQNPLLTIVFKDNQANEEEFRVTDYEPIPFQNDIAAFEVYIKSFRKQSGTTNNNVNNLGG